MLLSHREGIRGVKSLLHAHSPSSFIVGLRNLYKSLAAAETSCKTDRIGEDVHALDGYLRRLDVSYNPGLRHIPVKCLCEMKTLEFLDCEGSPQVYGLPPEVAKLGGVKAMTYLKEINRTGKPSTELQIIVIGNGEAGKSSLINCVVNELNDTSAKINEDDRTVGIDITEWKPQAFDLEETTGLRTRVDPKGLTCRFLDLAGQQVYACTNQFFLVPRALYIIAWRVLDPSRTGEHVGNQEKARELESMILNYMEALQIRVPGASIVMVATHIDAAAGKDGKMTKEAWAEVELQCGFVEKIVRRKLAQIQSESAAANVAALDVFANGRSVQVQCLEGTNVKHLRRTLIDMAHSLPWWNELIPGSYKVLRDKIDSLRNDRSKPCVWLKWDDYRQHATDSGIDGDSALIIATSFLSEMAVIKFFGSLNDKAMPVDPDDLLDTTVFICPAWIIDGLKGLIRHDRDTLMEYLHRQTDLVVDEQRRLLQHVNRLATYGICHSSLVPFLWPDGGDEDAAKYWSWLKAEGVQAELRLWPGLTSTPQNAFATSKADYDRVLALLGGCDFLFKKVAQRTGASPGEEDKKETVYVAPVLPVQDAKMDARSFSATDCPIKHEYTITGTAPGFFERLLVRVHKAYSYMECSKAAGVFYHRALKAQVFLVDGSRGQGKASTQGAAVGSSHKSGRPSVPSQIQTSHLASTVAPFSVFESSGGLSGNCKHCGQDKKMHDNYGRGGYRYSLYCQRNIPTDVAGPGASRLKSNESVGQDVNDSAGPVLSKLSVLTSTRAQQLHIMEELKDLGRFFPGMTIGPWINEAMINADLDAASKEPVHIRVLALSKTVASRVKEAMVNGDKEGSKGVLQLRVEASEVGGEDQPEHVYQERYMDFSSRVLVVCMERLGRERWKASRVLALREELDSYEKTYVCQGQLVDARLRDMYQEELPRRTQSRHDQGDAVRGGCTHNGSRGERAHQGPCHECYDAEAFDLAEKGNCDEAAAKLVESARIRDKPLANEFVQTKWVSTHRRLIDGLRDEARQQQRMIAHERNPNAKARQVLKVVMSLLDQLLQTEKNCGECCEEETRVLKSLKLPSGKSSPNASGTASREAAKDAVDKRVYFEKKYALMWARLEVLQSRLRAAMELPRLQRQRDKVQAMQYGITDMRRAHDALKSNRQKADGLAESAEMLSAQLVALRAIETATGEMDEHLEEESKWLVYTEELMYHVRRQVKVIPVIMPGYFADVEAQRGKVDFSRWWPERMRVMEDYALFTRLDVHKTYDHNFSTLMAQINKHLDDWRGKPPPADVFEPPAKIPCYRCVDCRERNPHTFDRIAVEAELAGWRETRLQSLVAEGALPSLIEQFSFASSFRTRSKSTLECDSDLALELASPARCLLQCEVPKDTILDPKP